MKIPANVAVATAMTVMVFPAQAGGGARPQAHGAPMHQPRVHQPMQHSSPARGVAPHGAHTVSGQAHIFFGGPRLERRPDPNYRAFIARCSRSMPRIQGNCIRTSRPARTRGLPPCISATVCT